MIQVGSTDATSAAGIPYRHESVDMAGSALDALLVAVSLLAGCLAALWYAKKRGWLSKWIAPIRAGSGASDMELVQALRLGPKTTLYKVRDGARDYVVLESTVPASLITNRDEVSHESS